MKKLICIILSLLIGSSVFLAGCDVNTTQDTNTSQNEQSTQPSTPTNPDVQHQHKYSETVTGPTCTSRGFTTHTCSVCGDSYVDTYTKATGHQIEGDRCAKCGVYDVLDTFVGNVYEEAYVESKNCFMFYVGFYNSQKHVVSTDGDVSIHIKTDKKEVYSSKKTISEADFEIGNTDSDKNVPLLIISIPADEVITPDNESPSGALTIAFEGGTNVNNTQNRYEQTFDLPYPYKKVVTYLTDRKVSSAVNNYTITFGLKDQTQKNYLSADISVAVRIVNDDGKTVYKSTLTALSSDFYTSQNKLLVDIKIPKKEIAEGTTYTGKLYYKVFNESGSFNEYSSSLSDLPYEKAVTYITDRNVVTNNDSYTITFGLLDQTQKNYLSADISVAVRIVNDNNQTVYQKTHTVSSSQYYTSGNKLLVDVKILKNEITEGTTSEGKLYYKVFDKSGSFDELSYSLTDLPYQKPIEYITSRKVTSNDDNYTITFGFLDKTQKEYLTSDVSVAVRIVNAKNQTVYQKTLTASKSDYYSYQGKLLVDIKIPKNEIHSSTFDGTLYYKVTAKNVWFNEYNYAIYDLPTDMTVSLPKSPLTINYYNWSGKLAARANITQISYTEKIYTSFDEVDINLTLIGTKTYDIEGAYYSRSCHIGYKVYDGDDFVIASGTAYTEAIATGEKFKEIIRIEIRNWSKLTSHEFRVELLDVR